jgi:hypothetical protein
MRSKPLQPHHLPWPVKPDHFTRSVLSLVLSLALAAAQHMDMDEGRILRQKFSVLGQRLVPGDDLLEAQKCRVVQLGRQAIAADRAIAAVDGEGSGLHSRSLASVIRKKIDIDQNNRDPLTGLALND